MFGEVSEFWVFGSGFGWVKSICLAVDLCFLTYLSLCVSVCVCVVSLYRSRCPTFHLFCLSGHQFGPQPENLCPASAEGRSVITARHTIKLLPRSDRWQLPEGLFIFCLLIRAAGERRGCRGGGRGGLLGAIHRRG